MADYPVLDLILTKTPANETRVRDDQLIEVPEVKIYGDVGSQFLIGRRSGGLFANRALTLNINYGWNIGWDPLENNVLLLVPCRE